MVINLKDQLILIKRQFNAGEWPQFLESIQIDGLHGISGQIIDFRFPITALVGENGTGKSTFLKAAACAYNNINLPNYYHSTFFVSTQWDTISNVTIVYKYKQGSNISTINVTKPSNRWRNQNIRPKRCVYYYDISRTLPLDATVGYAKIAKQSAGEISTKDLDSSFKEYLSFIMGKQYSNARFVSTKIATGKEIGLLNYDFGEVSQFHQGSGEQTTLDAFKLFEKIPNYSLLIIDEIEASLHPRAQHRLLQFLFWLCRVKKLQIILSTHSPSVLDELPEEGRVLLFYETEGINVMPCISTDFAMSKIDDIRHPELIIYVEDEESKIILLNIIMKHDKYNEIISRIDIRTAGAASNLKILGILAKGKRLPNKTLCILDGDLDPADGCTMLPGDLAPEKMIFNDLKTNGWPEIDKRLGWGAGELYCYIDDAMLNPDHHLWTRIIGDKLLKSYKTIWEVFVEQWCKHCLKIVDIDRIVNEIEVALS